MLLYLKEIRIIIGQFQQNKVPDNVPEVTLDVPVDGLLIGQVLKLAGLVSSASDGVRMIKQGAVKLDNEKN